MTEQIIIQNKVDDLTFKLLKCSDFKFELTLERSSSRPIAHDVIIIPLTHDFNIINHHFHEDNVTRKNVVLFSFIGKIILAILKEKRCIFYTIIENDIEGNTRIIHRIRYVSQAIEMILSAITSGVKPYSISI